MDTYAKTDLNIKGTLKQGNLWKPGTPCKIFDDRNKLCGNCHLSKTNRHGYLSFSVNVKLDWQKFFIIEFGKHKAPFFIPPDWPWGLLPRELSFNEVLLIDDPDIVKILMSFTTSTLAAFILNVRSPQLNQGHTLTKQPSLFWLDPNDLTDFFALRIVLHVWNSQPVSPFQSSEDLVKYQGEQMDTFCQLSELKESWSKYLQSGGITKGRFKLPNESDLQYLERLITTVQENIAKFFPSQTTMFPKIFNIEVWGESTGVDDPRNPGRNVR